MKKIVLVFMSTLFGVIAFGQELPDNTNLNDCVTAHKKSPMYTEVEIEYAIYVGDNFKQEFLDTIEIILQEAERRWISQYFEGCKSPEPEKCVVLQWKGIPEIIDTVIIADTTRTEDYIYEYFIKEVVIEEEEEDPYFYKKMLCPNDVTYDIVKNLQTKLYEEGFYMNEINGVLDTPTKKAIQAYQKSNRLMISLYADAPNWKTIPKQTEKEWLRIEKASNTIDMKLLDILDISY